MTPVDALLIAFLMALAALAALVVPAPWLLLARLGALAAALLVAGRLRPRSRAFRFVHDFLPVPIVSVLINLIGPVVEHANPLRWDAVLASLDAGPLRWLAQPWAGAAGRPGWLTAAASLAYFGYYFVPVGTALALWLRGRADEFARYVFVVCAVILASYAAYFIAPATGPRLPGHAAPMLDAFLRLAERNQLDAFPSGHTAVSIAFVVAAWPAFPRLRAAFALIAAAIVFSTVYLSLHYTADVLAGAALAAATLPFAPRLYARLSSPAVAASARARPRPS